MASSSKRTLNYIEKWKAEEKSTHKEAYLAPAFYFRVIFLGNNGSPDYSSSADNSFLEVSGLTAEIENETVGEGGENRFVHQL